MQTLVFFVYMAHCILANDISSLQAKFQGENLPSPELIVPNDSLTETPGELPYRSTWEHTRRKVITTDWHQKAFPSKSRTGPNLLATGISIAMAVPRIPPTNIFRKADFEGHCRDFPSAKLTIFAPFLNPKTYKERHKNKLPYVNLER